MPEFLVELHRPEHGWDELQALGAQARAAAEQVNSKETPIRFLRSIFVPDNETCFYLFEAGSIDVVREAAQRAGLELEHVAEAVPDDVAADTA